MECKHFDDFHLAGFTYYQGVKVFHELKIGTNVVLKAEPENKYDENAVAIYYKHLKLGYIPRNHNLKFSRILNAGHNIFEAYIQSVSPENISERQFRVVTFVKDNNS